MLEVLDQMNEHTVKEKRREPVLNRDKTTNEVVGLAPKYIELVRQIQHLFRFAIIFFIF